MSAKRNFAFYATALIGTALGTAAGILLAPKSGEATRKDIKRMAGELSEQFPSVQDIKLKGRQALKNAPNLLTRTKRPSNVIQLYREKES